MGDILSYEIGFAAKFAWNVELINKVEPPLDYTIALLDNRIEFICQRVGATRPPRIYLTGDNNFRIKVAKTRPYKGTRKHDYPPHYEALRHYMMKSYDCYLIQGMEADDALAIKQTARLHLKDTVICTRDKDLRMVEGYTYSWAIAKQDEWAMEWVDKLGWIDLKENKLIGTGTKFFYSQMLTGDTVDNIGGLPNVGAKKALALLKDIETIEECFFAVRDLYKKKVGALWELYMREQGQLLWMCRELKDGKPVLWEIPEFD